MGKEVILNTALKMFNFSFYIKGRLVTVQLLPGSSRVEKKYIEYLRKIRMFSVLENDHVINVGVKESVETMDAIELGKGVEVPEKVETPEKVEVPEKVETPEKVEVPEKAETPKKTTKKLTKVKTKKTKTINMDLEEL